MKTPKPPFNTPFKDELPRPSPQRFKDLEAQLKTDGQRIPAEVDEEGNILDGHTRYEILGDKVKYVVVDGFKSIEHKRAYVRKRGRDSRQHTAKQEKDIRAGDKELARHFHSTGETQQWIARELGVCQQTVSNWITKVGKSPSSRDGRRKITPEQEEEIVQRITDGDTSTDIAKDYGVDPSLIRKIKKRREVCRVPQELGPPPKTITGRGLHYEAMLANGSTRANATVACRFNNDNAARLAAKIASQGSAELKEVVDGELIGVWAAAKLLDVPPAQQTTAIEDVKLKDAAKRTSSREKVAIKAKSKADDLFELLEQTWVGWYAFQRNTLGTGKWIGQMSAANADRINEKMATVGPLVEGVIATIQKQLRRK